MDTYRSAVDELLVTLRESRTIDITTVGRRSGEPRRIETWAWPDGNGRLYLTGSPGRRDWYANLKATPDFVLHVKRGPDVEARARPVEGPAERREVLTRLLDGAGCDLEAWIAASPLVEVSLDRPA